MIKGGYILQPRIIQESDISVAPPYVREIWGYLLREANCQDNKYNGHEIKRGQLFRSYDDIKEGTKWFIGWRKMTYNENQTKKAMKFLRDTQRITTTKELGGVMITVCKYDYYQSPKNYDRTTKDAKDRTIREPLENHTPPDNNKKEENIKNDNNEEEPAINKAWLRWKEYKKTEFNFNYKSEISELAAKNELINLAGNNEEIAIKIIEQSIAKGWKGFFKLKINGNGYNGKPIGASDEAVARIIAAKFGSDKEG
jgi:hypothetical protein